MVERTLTLANQQPNENGQVAETDSVEPTENKSIVVKRTIPWFAGCEYVCKECGEVEFYHEDLRAHIRKTHGDPDDYLDKHQQFETKTVWFQCQLCQKDVRRHYTAMFRHLFSSHKRMKLETYRKRFNIPQEYEITVLVDPRYLKQDSEPPKPKEAAENPAEETKPLMIKLRRIEELKDQVPEEKKADDPQNHGPPPLIHINDILMNNLHQPLPPPKIKIVHSTPPWYVGCEYQCKECEKMFYDVTKLLFHIKAKHGLTSKPYVKKFGKLSTKMKCYICNICQTKVKHQKSSISKHLAKSHNLELEAYATVFHPDPGSVPANPDKLMSKANEPMSEFVSWSKGSCEYLCKICNETFEVSAEIWNHVSAIHRKSVSEYKSIHGHPGIKIKEVFCKGCSANIDHDTTELMKHAKNTHGLTLRQLYLTFFAETKELPDPTETNHGTMKTDDEYEVWINQCSYDCRICPSQFKTDAVLIRHVKIEHNMSKLDYKAQFGKLVTRIVHFKCPYCNCNVLHVANHLGLHLKRCAQTSLQEFYMTKVKNKGILTTSEKPGEAQLSKSATAKLKHADRDYDKWSNQCSYQCKECNYSYNCDNGLIKHIKYDHNMDKHDYKKKHGKFVTKIVYFTCPFCQTKVLHVTNHLGFHIKRCGKMKLHDFYNEYIARKPREQKKLEPPPLLSPPLSSSEEMVEVGHKFIRELNRWATQCEYQCRICQTSFDQDALLVRHFILSHNITKPEYKDKYGELMTKKVMFKCPQCCKEVFRVKKRLGFHAKTCCNMTLGNYYRSYVQGNVVTKPSAPPPAPPPLQPLPTQKPLVMSSKPPKSEFELWANQCKITCQICSETFTNDGVAAMHMRRIHMLELADYKATYGDIWTDVSYMDCPKCHKQVMLSSMYLGRHFKECAQMTTIDFYNTYIKSKTPDDDWLDKCTFTCKICLADFRSRAKGFAHVGETHKMDMTSYIKEHGYMLSKTVTFDCPKCHNSVLHEKNVLTTHITKTCLKMSLEDFYRTHVKGEKPIQEEQPKTVQSKSPQTVTDTAFEEWIFAHKFSCTLCSKQFNFPNQLRAHLRSTHAMSKEEYLSFKSSMPRAQFKSHHCQLCGLDIVQGHLSLSRHFSAFHPEISVKDYFYQYVAKSLAPSPRDEKPSQPRYHDDVVEWANKCVWKCPVCPEASSNKEKVISNHIWKFHKGEGVGQLNPVILTDVSCECAICQATIRHDYKSLHNHITQAHNLTMRAYHQQYVKAVRVQADASPSNVVDKVPPITVSMSLTKPCAVEEDQDYLDWRNKCEYKCRLCPQEFRMRRLIRIHIKRLHMPVQAYVRKFGGLESKMVCHKCYICGANVPHDAHLLQGHIGTIHRISLKDYYRTYVEPKRTEIESQDKEKKSWMDQCEFRCALCQSVFTSKPSFCQHIASDHGTNFDAYFKDFGNPLSKSKVHSCLVCGSMVMCEAESLEAHMVKIHQLSLDQYHEKYMQSKQSGDIVTITRVKRSDDAPSTSVNDVPSTSVNDEEEEPVSELDFTHIRVPESNSLIEMDYDHEDPEDVADNGNDEAVIIPGISLNPAAYDESQGNFFGEEAIVDDEMAEENDIDIDEFNIEDHD